MAPQPSVSWNQTDFGRGQTTLAALAGGRGGQALFGPPPASVWWKQKQKHHQDPCSGLGATPSCAVPPAWSGGGAPAVLPHSSSRAAAPGPPGPRESGQRVGAEGPPAGRKALGYHTSPKGIIHRWNSLPQDGACWLLVLNGVQANSQRKGRGSWWDHSQFLWGRVGGVASRPYLWVPMGASGWSPWGAAAGLEGPHWAPPAAARLLGALRRPGCGGPADTGPQTPGEQRPLHVQPEELGSPPRAQHGQGTGPEEALPVAGRRLRRRSLRALPATLPAPAALGLPARDSRVMENHPAPWRQAALAEQGQGIYGTAARAESGASALGRAGTRTSHSIPREELPPRSRT